MYDFGDCVLLIDGMLLCLCIVKSVELFVYLVMRDLF